VVASIINMMMFCKNLLEKVEDKNDYEIYLPEILSSKFLEIEANSILDLALNARNDNVD
jgi:hypothetical protein